MTTVTARNLITDSMKLLGLLVKGDSPADDEIEDGLYRLNDIISTWSLESLLINARVTESFPLTGGQLQYTIGPGGNFDTTRPTAIISMFYRVANLDYPVYKLTDEAYALQIGMKNIQNPFPEYYNYTLGWPLGTLKFWPVPSSTNSIYILSEKTISGFTTLDTVVDLPPGWARALRYALALEMAPEYGKDAMQTAQVIKATADEAKGMIKAENLRNRPLDYIPSDLNQRYSILTDRGY